MSAILSFGMVSRSSSCVLYAHGVHAYLLSLRTYHPLHSFVSRHSVASCVRLTVGRQCLGIFGNHSSSGALDVVVHHAVGLAMCSGDSAVIAISPNTVAPVWAFSVRLQVHRI